MDSGVGTADLGLEGRFVDLDVPVLLSGIQALVRVLLEVARLDRAAGHNTAGLVSGYRGSPLGGVDLELWHQAKLLKANGIRFQPGLNEDLAATMLWGTQQIDVFPGKRVDGVFGMWYGKGPGVERSGDALHAANMLGTSRLGGVLAVSGDDHAAHSSTYPHQTEPVFHSAMIPVLVPADVGEILDFGLAGLALSRFAGCWAAMKTIAETAEQSATLIVPAERRFATPDFPLPPHGLNFDVRLPWPERRAELERRVVEERLPAAVAFAAANRLDRLMAGGADAPIGLVTVGKAHHDAMRALRLLGLAGSPLIAVYKLGLAWPIEAGGLRRFAAGKRGILVIEEKRGLVEVEVRDALYNLPADRRPVVAGKRDSDDSPLLPAVMELSPEIIAPPLARFLRRLGIAVADPALPLPLERPAGLLFRLPTFCAGCPHNTSTRVLEGSFAAAGIGCHTMAIENPGPTRTFTHMGGEGVTWAGLSPFVSTPHLFANMGDGTYQHSGILAIRQAVAAGTSITYKILYNDAVAMTGGQPVEGAPTVAQIAQQLAAEGVRTIAVVADDRARLPPARALPPGTKREGRERLDAVQRALRGAPGVSVLIYDQVCATEKRRRRKRGRLAEAGRNVLINPEVCENCGDCTARSHCIAIEPVETPLGRKRRISPTACNADFSCLKGFCPSFVTIAGAHPEPEPVPILARETELGARLGEAVPAGVALPWRALFAGIGGGGVVTTGAIVAMAAHLEGRAVRTLSFTGLAQKNGPVISHVQISDEEKKLDVVRIPLAGADFMLAADLAVAASGGVLDRCRKDAAVIGNLDLAATVAFLAERDLSIDAERHRRVIAGMTDAGRSCYLHAGALAERLFGTAQALNTLLLGMAWQRGLVPVGRAALERAIELNGAAVAMNRRAFLWGRILGERPELGAEILEGGAVVPPPQDLDALVSARAAALEAYQDASLAQHYRTRVAAIAAREAEIAGVPGGLARAVVTNLYRVLAYKDEYEVARLLAAARYGRRPVFHLSPPLPLGRDPATGQRRKIALPGWAALPLFRALRHGKRLRGSVFDPFGWQKERRMERQMIHDYEADLARILESLSPETRAAAQSLAGWPDAVRGFGPVKREAWVGAMGERRRLLAELAAPPVRVAA
ncbi:MAG: indolepyruvate ferredoxin oxidoreductase family protein [Rhodospirillales bacterium]|nr:indolepyruvate ferredoxin oxidoreductase family protein [Rhodospirillales bacterium]